MFSISEFDYIKALHFIMLSVFVSSGMEDYLQRYSEGIKRVLNTFGPVPEFSGEAAAKITKV